jgi:hypothetical protein
MTSEGGVKACLKVSLCRSWSDSEEKARDSQVQGELDNGPESMHLYSSLAVEFRFVCAEV